MNDIVFVFKHLNPLFVSHVNRLFQDQRWGGSSGHILAFLHHMSQRLKSTRKLINIFTDYFHTFSTSFSWMSDLLNKFKVQIFLFLFLQLYDDCIG